MTGRAGTDSGTMPTLGTPGTTSGTSITTYYLSTKTILMQSMAKPR